MLKQRRERWGCKSMWPMHTSREIDTAFETIARQGTHAVFVSSSPFFVGRRVQLAQLAALHRLPTTYSLRDFAEIGGLMSYGPHIGESYRQIGLYAGRILKGTKPADLPVAQGRSSSGHQRPDGQNARSDHTRGAARHCGRGN